MEKIYYAGENGIEIYLVASHSNKGYYPDMPAGAFLIYMAKLKGMSTKKAKKKMEELLEIVSLTDVRNKTVGSLLGGMKQRAILAQALLNDPKVLILDEPTVGVDPQERIRIRC